MDSLEVSKEQLGDRVKGYEKEHTKSLLDDDLPICVRLDGKAFHTYTKGLERPFDERLSKVMIEVTNYLVEKTNARLGYTQSDEISLVYFKTSEKQQSFFGGKIQKLTSVLASMATAKFAKEVDKVIPEKSEELAIFDCRVWNVPTLKDAAEVFVWRQEDAIKNAVSMAAHTYLDFSSVQKKHTDDRIAMLLEAGINFEDYPEFFKSGTFSKKYYVLSPIPEELKKYHPEHVETYMRATITNFQYPRLKYVDNIEDLLFTDWKSVV